MESHYGEILVYVPVMLGLGLAILAVLSANGRDDQ